MKQIPGEVLTVEAETGEVKKVETANWNLMPPKKGVCQVCGKDHSPDMPHDAQSLYYQYAFYAERKRWPNWKDAMEHCTPEMKELWIQALNDRNVDVEGGKIYPEREKENEI